MTISLTSTNTGTGTGDLKAQQSTIDCSIDSYIATSTADLKVQRSIISSSIGTSIATDMVDSMAQQNITDYLIGTSTVTDMVALKAPRSTIGSSTDTSIGTNTADLKALQNTIACSIGTRFATGTHESEAAIPDGSNCLAAGPAVDSRQRRFVLVELRDERDPETGERCTFKRYESEKGDSEDGTWRYVSVILKPENGDFDPSEFATDDKERLRVEVELVAVL